MDETDSRTPEQRRGGAFVFWATLVLATLAAVPVIAVLPGAAGAILLVTLSGFVVGYLANRWGLIPCLIAGVVVLSWLATADASSSCSSGSDCLAPLDFIAGLGAAVFLGAGATLGVLARRRRGGRPLLVKRPS